jgi:hypothetical protein
MIETPLVDKLYVREMKSILLVFYSRHSPAIVAVHKNVAFRSLRGDGGGSQQRKMSTQFSINFP